MKKNLDIIVSELNIESSKIKHLLDIVEPIFHKDKYQIQDIDILRTIDIEIVKIADIHHILMPLITTDENGYIKERDFFKILLFSSFRKLRKRFDNLFESKIYIKDEKINEYKTSFFELGYYIEFIDSFITSLKKQSDELDLIFAIFGSYNLLFDFSELVSIANKEKNLDKRKEIYLEELNKINLYWLNNSHTYKCGIGEENDDTGECEPYNEDIDEDFQEAKRDIFAFMENCQKAIESINFQIKNKTIALPATITLGENKPTKFEILKSNLYNNGFYELSKFKTLSPNSQSKLIDLIILNDTPYNVAMFDFLGYFKYLTNELGYTNSKIHSKIGSWLETSAQTIKCNILVLNEKSALRENDRYTSHLHKEKVKIDYNSLK